MPLFTNISRYYKDLNILILGSYHPENFPTVQGLKDFLISEGFLNVKLGSDIPEEDFLAATELTLENNEKIYLKICRAMREEHFNFFIFFDTNNESTQAELMSLIQENYLEKNSRRVLVFFPAHFSAIMLEGFVSYNKLNVFRYQSEVEIFQRCISYIKQNLFGVFRVK